MLLLSHPLVNEKNIVNAAKWCKNNNVGLISFSGFKKKNKLNLINKKGLSFWVDPKHIIMWRLLICF